jgi:E3 ubiquitin-protein ligase NEDD4
VTTYYRENDITRVIDETFTTTEECSGEMVTIDLKPGGAGVAFTQANKEEYIGLMVEYRISKRVKDQFDAYMSGFSELIPQDLINVFDERELEWLIGGISEIDVYVFSFLFSLSQIGVLRFYGRDDWVKFMKYRGCEVDDEVILEACTFVATGAAIASTTVRDGTTRIPVFGFKDLQGPDGPRRFTIEKAGDPDQLPKRHTPFNRIDLPPYKDYASLEFRLTLAVGSISL